ncbi:MAG: hypothetical protein IJG52_06180 [Lachnospiraceae bacterium]|nr:hypothetical protein [Lachnospiraceae bacterium]
MIRCQMCGKEFDMDEAREAFEKECDGVWSYDSFDQCLCAECAAEVMDTIFMYHTVSM